MQRRMEPVVRADQPRHDQLPGDIHHVVAGLGGKEQASGDDDATLHAQVHHLDPRRLEFDDGATLQNGAQSAANSSSPSPEFTHSSPF